MPIKQPFFLKDIYSVISSIIDLENPVEKLKTSKQIEGAINQIYEFGLIENLYKIKNSKALFLQKILSSLPKPESESNAKPKNNCAAIFNTSHWAMNCFKIESGSIDEEVARVCDIALEFVCKNTEGTVNITGLGLDGYTRKITERTKLLRNIKQIKCTINTEDESRLESAIESIKKTTSLTPAALLESIEEQFAYHNVKIYEDINTSSMKANKDSIDDVLISFDELCSVLKFRYKQESPIRIVTPSEAQRCPANLLIVVNSTFESIPGKVTSNPYTPTEIQNIMFKERGVTMLYDALRRFDSAIQSSVECYFSYPLFDGDISLTPHPAIDVLPHLHRIKPEIIKDDEKISTEIIDDEIYLPLPPSSFVSGGTGVFDKYAKCSFLGSYMTHSKILKASSPITNIENLATGDIIHRFMEAFWGHYKNTKALNLTSLDVQEAFFEKTLNETFKRTIETYNPPFWFEALYRGRLASLLKKFIENEKMRNFEVVGIETKHHIKVGDLRLSIMLDRTEIETAIIEDKKHEFKILSDYKSGQISPSDWTQTPLTKPQLPLYSLVDEFDGILYNMLREDFVGYKGITPKGMAIEANHHLLNVDKDKFEKLKMQWKQELESLASTISSGKSIPIPSSKQDCKTCHLRKVCRTNENASR